MLNDFLYEVYKQDSGLLVSNTMVHEYSICCFVGVRFVE